MVMSTALAPESDVTSSWLAQAAAFDDAINAWRREPFRSRNVRCGVAFDGVLCRRAVAELAHRILDAYEQPIGPAVVNTALDLVLILVPAGTSSQWSDLMDATQWPRGARRPICLGTGHRILIPPLEPKADSAACWLQPPTTLGMHPPDLTNPVPLARCLDQARTQFLTEETRMRSSQHTLRHWTWEG
ncbi:hypothetical protein [Streptomyces jumonjinensis]|uniref:Uncharacterized protein n=1 Tax=Streptomyces jumonjinensis TaxID=1945 RepID=A0A646KR93_STRJU|nr:hypothetical protein [Streptomyces jumonjinensis]MQT04773.1 hypothetical protein [Streptomyces jumonjinensis]